MQSCSHITIVPYYVELQIGKSSLRKTILYKYIKYGYLVLAHLHNSSGNYGNRVKVNLQIFYDPLVVFHDLVILFKLVIFYDPNKLNILKFIHPILDEVLI